MITTYYFLSLIMLIYNTFKDIKTREIDERYNYFAFGATFMLLAYFKTSIIFIFALSFLTGLIIFITKRFMALGDLQALTWILLGFGAIEQFKIVKFLIAFTMLLVITLITKKFIKREQEETPGYILILGSYIITIFW